MLGLGSVLFPNALWLIKHSLQLSPYPNNCSKLFPAKSNVLPQLPQHEKRSVSYRSAHLRERERQRHTHTHRGTDARRHASMHARAHARTQLEQKTLTSTRHDLETSRNMFLFQNINDLLVLSMTGYPARALDNQI